MPKRLAAGRFSKHSPSPPPDFVATEVSTSPVEGAEETAPLQQVEVQPLAHLLQWRTARGSTGEGVGRAGDRALVVVPVGLRVLLAQLVYG